MAEWRPPKGIEIDKKLRDDFRLMLREYGITTQETDPLLAVLFRSLAVQVEEVYEQAAQTIPLAIIDELMTGLGMPERRSQPAQTVIRLSLQKGRQHFDDGTELLGEAQSKERLGFAFDTPVEVSPAQISLVAIYQNGVVRLHQGTELPKELEDARPSFEPVPAELGPHPAIFLAVDVPDERHLSNHGFYFELVPEAKDTLAYLQREAWCLLDDDGEVQAKGLLRSQSNNGGVRLLEWLTPDSRASTTEVLLPDGFYGGRVFKFPEVPSGRAFTTQLPRKMGAPLRQIFQAGGAALFTRPRAWIRIGLPQEAATIDQDIVRIVLHCTTASNVEVLNQTINFGDSGTSIPISNGGGLPRYLVKPISIKGERGSEYLHESNPTATAETGRYRIRSGRLEIESAQTPRGVSDRFANVRLLLSNGKLANGVSAGAIKTFLRNVSVPTLEIINLTAAAGGTDGENFKDARRRFAELLLSRERAVTHLDIEAIVRAFEPRVRNVKCQSVLERAVGGLCRTQRISVALDRKSFTVPEEQARVLKEELESHLQQRALMGLKVRVAIEWI